MEDAELEAIRQQRMQQLMGGKGMSANPEEAQKQEEARQLAEEQRQMMLHALMTADARERLHRIALVKPEKARTVENMILAAAKRGALQGKVSEDGLKRMLEQISEAQSTKTKVTIQRRRPLFDDDD